MSTVAEIKAAIARLTLEKRAEVASCLHECKGDAWYKQVQQDLAAGKLDRLLAKANCAKAITETVTPDLAALHTEIMRDIPLKGSSQKTDLAAWHQENEEYLDP
jgi:hypothetical protein